MARRNAFWRGGLASGRERLSLGAGYKSQPSRAMQDLPPRYGLVAVKFLHTWFPEVPREIISCKGYDFE